MARLLGKPEFSGKLGNIVYVTWKGKAYARIAPSWRGKYNPTEKQVQNQERFRFAMKLLRDFREMLNLTIEEEPRQTMSSAAMKTLLNGAIVGTHPEFSVDYSKLVVARGSLLPATNAAVESTGTGLKFTWTDETGDNSSYNNAILIACEPRCQEMFYELNGPYRQDLAGELPIPEKWHDVELHTWIAFRSRDFKLKANSVYTGLIRVKTPEVSDHTPSPDLTPEPPLQSRGGTELDG